MKQTAEQILKTALHLFAQNGYEAVSTSQIAGELGITKGALYKHYASKRAIFEQILRRMEAQDAENATENDLPAGTADEMPETYADATLADVFAFSKKMFHYWTADAFAADFRRMLTLEQYRSPEMSALYAQYLVTGPTGYVRDLFREMHLPNAEACALRLYGTMFYGYSAYDCSAEKAAVVAQVEKALDDLFAEMKGSLS